MLYKPAPLKKGSKIGIVAPAKPVDIELLDQVKGYMEESSYELVYPGNVKASYGYLAGTDAQRAEGFESLFCDDTIDAIWCFAGGYGSMRILDKLDFEKIKQNPKIFIGMSDITALHIALLQEASLITYLGPTVSVIHRNRVEKSSYTENYFLETLRGEDEETTYLYPTEAPYHTKILRKGIAEAPIVGGNLAMITSLMGTKWQLDTRGKILLLEDVNEPPYKVDRMLTQLKLSGMFDHVKGLILATFYRCESEKQTLSLEQVFNDVLSGYDFPVLYGFPSGHIKDMLTIPLGSFVRMEEGVVTPLKKRNHQLLEA
ncbi:MAG: putative murein peptide carboxypeptidase [Chlamydiia bacterium]|nr:putative murein peptide carboxypeptidase [Chlamydiia bacterium]